MEIFEPGQNRKIAALRISFHVHIFFGVIIMNHIYMDEAFKEANKAFIEGEIPIGAIIVKNNEIIGRGHNTKEANNCSLYHAEINAIISASKKLNNWRLDDCDIYVTLDPCPMCASAIKQARIKCIYSAVSNSDSSNSDIINKILSTNDINHSVSFISNINVEEGKEILQKFFLKRRK